MTQTNTSPLYNAVFECKNHDRKHMYDVLLDAVADECTAQLSELPELTRQVMQEDESVEYVQVWDGSYTLVYDASRQELLPS